MYDLCPGFVPIRQLQGNMGTFDVVANIDMHHIESDCTQAAQWFTATFSPAVDVGHVWSVRGTHKGRIGGGGYAT